MQSGYNANDCGLLLLVVAVGLMAIVLMSYGYYLRVLWLLRLEGAAVESSTQLRRAVVYIVASLSRMNPPISFDGGG